MRVESVDIAISNLPLAFSIFTGAADATYYSENMDKLRYSWINLQFRSYSLIAVLALPSAKRAMLVIWPPTSQESYPSLITLVQVRTLAPLDFFLFIDNRPSITINALHFDIRGVVSVEEIAWIWTSALVGAIRTCQGFISKWLLPAALLTSAVTLSSGSTRVNEFKNDSAK